MAAKAGLNVQYFSFLYGFVAELPFSGGVSGNSYNMLLGVML